MIIDCHGHYTTAPAAHTAWREAQRRGVGGRPGPAAVPGDLRRRDPRVDRDQPAAADGRARGRPDDLLPARLGHGPPRRRRVASAGSWAAALQRPHRTAWRSSSPTTSSASASCPSRRASRSRIRSPSCAAASRSWASSAATSTPTRAAGHWTSPPLTDRSWYPLYEAMVELDVPAMVHVSAVTNPNFHATGSHYLNADTTAFMQLLQARPVPRLPDLRLRHPARRRRRALPLGPVPRAGRHARPAAAPETRSCATSSSTPASTTSRASTCSSTSSASTTSCSARRWSARSAGIDPQTGHYFDDTRRYVEALDLTPADRTKVFEGNARRVYPRLSAALGARSVLSGHGRGADAGE